MVSLLTDLDAFYTEPPAVAASWTPASMGRPSGSTASAARGWPGVLTVAPGLTPAAEPPHHPGMNRRRRFLLVSLAGALAVPLGVEAQQTFSGSCQAIFS